MSKTTRSTKMSVRKRFKVLRIIQGKSQQQIATEAGISQEFISLIETGKARPSGKVRDRLARVLDEGNADAIFGPEADS